MEVDKSLFGTVGYDGLVVFSLSEATVL